MAHFYAEMSGNGKTVSRCGTTGSGLWAHLRGWGVGVEVRVDVNDQGEDEIIVWKTSGSRGKGAAVPIGRWTEKDVERLTAEVPPPILSRILPALGPRVVGTV